MSDLISRQAILKHIEKIRQRVQIMKYILLIITALTILLATGCGKVENKTDQEPVNVSRFKCVECNHIWEIVADRETGVMYAVSRGGYNQGTFTVLVDADGKPLIYDEGEQE